MMEASDAEAVAQAREGDGDAYRLLVERYSQRLFQLTYRMTGNEQDAEDLVQETFLRAYRQLDRFESRSNFGTWLHRIAVNGALDLLRKRKRSDGHADPIESSAAEEIRSLAARAPGPDRQIFHAELHQQITSALDLLTPTERAAFVLRHFEEKSIQEIGGALGLSNSAAKHSIFRAVQKMRRALEPMINAAR